ncbi:MAG: hypothetical protein ACOYJ2_07290 [Rickettsiales bacterium]
MILFFILAIVMALSVAWLLVMPSISADIARQQKWKTVVLVVVATILFPFLIYYLITF